MGFFASLGLDGKFLEVVSVHHLIYASPLVLYVSLKEKCVPPWPTCLNKHSRDKQALIKEGSLSELYFLKSIPNFFFLKSKSHFVRVRRGVGGWWLHSYIHSLFLSFITHGYTFFRPPNAFFFPKEIIRGRIPQGETCRQFAPFCTAARKTADWRSAAAFQGSWSLRTVCKYKDGPINHVQGFLSRLEKNVYSSSYSEASNHKCI